MYPCPELALDRQQDRRLSTPPFVDMVLEGEIPRQREEDGGGPLFEPARGEWTPSQL